MFSIVIVNVGKLYEPIMRATEEFTQGFATPYKKAYMLLHPGHSLGLLWCSVTMWLLSSGVQHMVGTNKERREYIKLTSCRSS